MPLDAVMDLRPMQDSHLSFSTAPPGSKDNQRGPAVSVGSKVSISLGRYGRGPGSGDRPGTPNSHRPHLDVICISSSPDGRRVAKTGYDRKVRLRDTATVLEVFTLRGHT